MLLVNDYYPELVEFHRILNKRMSSYNNVDRSFFKSLQNIATLFTSNAVRQHFNAQWAATEKIFRIGHYQIFQ